MSLGLLDKVEVEGTPERSPLVWPTLDRLRLDRETLAGRNAGIGGSDANVILSGNSERIRQLWLEKRGCLDRNNAWAAAAVDWLDNREAAKVHAAASKAIKAMVADDVARAFGHGIEAKRSRSGAITIRGLGA